MVFFHERTHGIQVDLRPPRLFRRGSTPQIIRTRAYVGDGRTADPSDPATSRTIDNLGTNRLVCCKWRLDVTSH